MTGTHKKGVQQIIIQYYVKVLYNYQYHSCEEILVEQWRQYVNKLETRSWRFQVCLELCYN